MTTQLSNVLDGENRYVSLSILGTTDVALRLGCSAERVRQLEREGKLSAEKTPRGVRVFRIEEVERLAVERERQKREQPHSSTRKT